MFFTDAHLIHGAPPDALHTQCSLQMPTLHGAPPDALHTQCSLQMPTLHGAPPDALHTQWAGWLGNIICKYEICLR